MNRKYYIPVWKSAPFVRLLLPLVCGIVLQWYLPVSFRLSIICGLILLIAFFAFYALSINIRLRFQSIQGLLLNGIIFCIGIFLTRNDDIRTDKNWFGHTYNDSSLLIVRLTEPLVEKEHSYKAAAVIESINSNTGMQFVKGNVLLYFSKEDTTTLPAYGDRILICRGLQTIKNSGNPGAFDYERYMSFQQNFHQVFLKKDSYRLLDASKTNPVWRFIYWSRDKTVSILQQNVQGDKKVTGIAEALLIGYKEDLDKDVVQAYSNTGVVHIIAISGMHLGLIYVVLVWLFSRIPLIKRSDIIKVTLILSCLWLFSLITGASASVLRSAVMFTCIIIGKIFFRQATIYNSLAASAFLLLCYDPYLLWDVGFQLSYLAVVGIVWLQRPIFNLFYTKHHWLQQLWEMCAITLAAQVLTLPVCIYYFHQLPVMFLITNLICVPLSTVILFAEIFLVLIAAMSPLALIAGKCIYVLTWLMNLVIDCCDKLPFSLLDMIYSTPVTTWLLYGVIYFLCSGLLHKKKSQLYTASVWMITFMSCWAYGRISFLHQKKIIIYNVNRHSAIDFIDGNKYCFYGDSVFYKEGALQNFHLKPARVSLLAEQRKDSLPALRHNGRFWQFYNKRMLIIDSPVIFESASQKLNTNILLISGNPKMSITDIASAVSPDCIVFDASNSVWKIGQWKKECEQLHLRCHSVAEDGAFILDAE